MTPGAIAPFASLEPTVDLFQEISRVTWNEPGYAQARDKGATLPAGPASLTACCGGPGNDGSEDPEKRSCFVKALASKHALNYCLLTPIDLSRELSVVGLIPKSSAAPPGP